MRKLIVTNNPMVYEAFSGKYLMIYDENTTYDGVLVCVRDNIHAGRKLLTHPLSGSIKPHETPYKTVLLNDETGALDMEGLALIEEAIASAAKFRENSSLKRRRVIPERILKDFQLVDFDLVRDIIENY